MKSTIIFQWIPEFHYCGLIFLAGYWGTFLLSFTLWRHLEKMTGFKGRLYLLINGVSLDAYIGIKQRQLQSQFATIYADSRLTNILFLKQSKIMFNKNIFVLILFFFICLFLTKKKNEKFVQKKTKKIFHHIDCNHSVN